MSYSPSYTDLFRRATFYTSRNGALAHEGDGYGWERTPWRAVQGGKRCATQARRRRVTIEDVDWCGDGLIGCRGMRI